jgi:hypothetical protein
VGLANLGSESETCVGSRVHLVGVSISFEKNFYRLPFTPPPLWFAVSVLQSPYFLVYGSEAILPVDVMWDSPAVEQYDEGISEDSRRVDIDGLEEACCAALIQSARYLEGI